tara:strand:+ start:1419 stop:3734 length:2316 start_codon:yes stop_codon:yes gene_type:complete
MKDFKIIEIMELFDEGEVTTADQMQRPQSALDREMFQDANKRFNKAGGGRIGFAKGDRGKGQYERGSLSKAEQKKIKDTFPNTKFDFDKYRYGVKKYPNIKNQNITNKDYTKVLRFIKKGFSTEMGKGLNVRGQPYSVEGKRLSLQDQEKIKSLFELPPGEEWDFKTHKYGIKQKGRENLVVRMARVVKDKKPWKIAADFGSTEGWMILQMNRVFKNETKTGVKPNKLTYQPQYKIINGKKKIIGFKDNTVAGGGKFYYGLNRHAKKNATSFVNHGDFKLNQKLVDISKRSFNQPNEVITGLLKDKGFTGKVNLNQLINFLSGTEATSADILRNAVVRHHNSGVAVGSATNDLSLTTQIINKRIVEAEKRIRTGNVLPADVQLLENNKIFVRGPDNKLYGSGSKTAIGQFKNIESNVATALQEGTDFKGKKFETKQLLSYLEKLGCGKSAGGRILRSNGGPTECALKGRNKLETIIKSGAKLDSNDAKLATQILKAGRSLGSAFTLSSFFGPAAIAFTAATEAGFVGYDMLTSGQTFKETIGDSLFNYALGEKTKIDPQKELFKRFSGLGYSDEQLGKFANVLNQTNQLNTIFKQDLKVGNLKDQVKALREQPKDIFMSPDDQMLQTDQAIRTEQALKDKSLNLDNLLTDYRSSGMEDTILGDMASGKFQDTQQDLKAANIFADLQKEQTARDNFLRFTRGDISKQARADRIAGLEQDYLNLIKERGPELTPFAGGGIAGLSGGIDEGPQVESMNPDSQGLQSLKNRARNI